MRRKECIRSWDRGSLQVFACELPATLAGRRNPCHCAGEGGCESLIYALLCRRPRKGWRLSLMSGLKTKPLRLVFKTLARLIFEPSISHLPLLHLHGPGKLEPPEHIILFHSNKTSPKLYLLLGELFLFNCQIFT